MDVEPLKRCICGAEVDQDECPYPSGRRTSADGRAMYVVNCTNNECGWQCLGWGADGARKAWNTRHGAGDAEDSARLDYIERTFSGMTNRERYLPVAMIWGKGANGRTLREACDKYMAKETPFTGVTFVEREMPPGVVAEVRTRHDRVTIVDDEDAARAGERG